MCFCQPPAAPNPSRYLEVLLEPLLTEALGQSSHPSLQLIAQGDLGWSSPVLFSNGVEYWILQENWIVLFHPGREAEVLCVWGCVSILLGDSSFRLGVVDPLESSSLPSGCLNISLASFGKSKEGQGKERENRVVFSSFKHFWET